MSDLMPVLQAAMSEPQLTISLDRNLFGGQDLVRLTKPGKTERSRPVALTPVIVCDDDQKPSDIVRMIADLLEKAGR